MVTAPEDELTCQELVEIVSDYLEGALPAGDRERFEAHLEICEGCRRYLDQMRTTIRVVGRLTEEDLDPRRQGSAPPALPRLESDVAPADRATGTFATPLLVIGQTKVLGFRPEALAVALRMSRSAPPHRLAA